MKILSVTLLLLLWPFVGVRAQGDEAARPVTSSLSLLLGQGQVRNTYLTPLLYSGADLTIQGQRWRLQRNLQWVNWQQAQASLLLATDRGDHSDDLSGRFSYRYGVLHRWQGLAGLPFSFYVGPYAGADLGFDYNLKMASSNNPATARITANLGAAGALSYRFQQPRAQGLKVTLQAHAPLLGMAFMPEYGASYYETFYLNTTQGNAHLTSLHNQQDLDLQLVADVPLAIVPWFRRYDSVLRVGASYHIETMDVNHTTTRYSRFGLVLGWVYEYLPFSRRKASLLNRPVYEY